MNLLTGVVYLVIAGYLAIAAPLVAGFHPVVVLSGSMEPTYHVGSVIYYKSAAFDKIQVGDPITFHGEDTSTLVTHRVVEKHETEQAFETEGDANGSRDPGMVPYSHVVGRAGRISIPYAGYFVNAGKQPASIIVMAVILAAGILLDKISEDDRKKQSEQTGRT